MSDKPQDGKGTYTYPDGRGTYDGEWKDGKRHGHGKFEYANGNKYDGDWVNDEQNGRATIVFKSMNVYTGDVLDNKLEGHGEMIYHKDIKDNNLASYKGEWKNNLYHGKGSLQFKSGQVWEGEWKEGDRDDGQGKVLKKDGSILYEGELKRDKYHGKGKLKCSDGTSYDGDFINGLFDGKGTIFYKDGSICYEGEFKKGTKDGKGKLTYADGKSYEGDFINDLFDGKGKLFYKDGSICYEGEFKENKMYGKGKYTYINGTTYDGDWIDSQYNGNGVLTEANGKKTEGYFENDKLLYTQLKITKSALNDCEDVFSREGWIDGNIITLHNPKTEEVFDTNATIDEKPFVTRKNRNICNYIFLKEEFDKYIENKHINPITREPIAKDEYKSYILRIVDNNNKSPKTLKSFKSPQSLKPKLKYSRSLGGKRTRRKRIFRLKK
jgi:hypothetical protein